MNSLRALPRRLWRLACLALHLVHGLWTVHRHFPHFDDAARNVAITRWSRRLLAILAVDIRSEGAAKICEQGGLMVANHVSWLDIFVLLARQPGVFVAKAEIRDWPVLGWLVAGVGTLFIERGNRASTRRTNEDIAAALQAGRTVTVFPEGRTTTGSRLAPFHSALLQSAIDAGVCVQPVGLRYLRPVGSLCEAADYIDDMSFLTSLWRIAGEPRIIAEVQPAPACATSGLHRRELALACENAIAAMLDLPPPRSRTDTPADPQDAPPSAVPPTHSRCPARAESGG